MRAPAFILPLSTLIRDTRVMDDRDKRIGDLQEQQDAVDAMIAVVEQNSEPFENVEERSVRLTLTRVLEELKALRDGLEEPERAARYPRALGTASVALLADVRRASGLTLEQAKRLCEEVDWDRERAMAAKAHSPAPEQR
jgi:hypothetical protein